MICSAEDLFTLNSNKFRMVYKVDGNPQLDSRDWSMYSNIFKILGIRFSYNKALAEKENFYSLSLDCRALLNI